MSTSQISAITATMSRHGGRRGRRLSDAADPRHQPVPCRQRLRYRQRRELNSVANKTRPALVIETKPGAGGSGFAESPGPIRAATPSPQSASRGSGAVLRRHLPYERANDFAPVVMFGVSPNVLVASTQTGSRRSPTGRGGEGEPGKAHLCLRRRRRLLAHGRRAASACRQYRRPPVPFRDQGLTEVMAGRIDYYFIPLAAAASALNSGKLNILRELAQAHRAVPGVPSIAEAGYRMPSSIFGWHYRCRPRRRGRS